MNKQTLQGNWNVMKGKIKEKWADLTDDDMLAIEGDADQLKGRIQERYGYAKDKVKEEVDKFMKEHGDKDGCCGG